MTNRPDDASSRRAFVVVAAGSGTRLGYGIPKAAAPLAGRSILARSLDSLTESLGLDVVVLVLPEDADYHQQLSAEAEALTDRLSAEVVITTGAGTRSGSVRAGIEALHQHAETQQWTATRVTTLIHDAARALTPAEVITRVTEAVESGAEAVVPAVPISDTVKRAEPRDDVEYVAETVPRQALRAIQTPQGFTLNFLDRAFAYIRHMPDDQAEQLTDEAMIAEELSVEVQLVPGDARAMKITTPTDLVTAEALLGQQSIDSLPESRSLTPRVGVGHDIHAFAPAEEPTELFLAGLHWPGHQGLAGHSDADPVAHACCAALFSAAGLGDLGTHFGADTIGTARDDVAGASGAHLLAEATRIVREAGFEIGNISAQFVGRRPKFAPRRQEAEEVLSRAAGAPVSVSGTTSDGLGFTGRSEGIAATATALVTPVP